jgi:dTDP-glucose 4,6-dehydratase
VSDEVQGIYRLFHSDRVDPTNIGNPHEFTIRQLAERVLTLTGSDSTIEHRPLPGDDPQVRRPDITVAREVLGWEPRIQLDEGLQKTIPYFRQLVEEQGAVARAM